MGGEMADLEKNVGLLSSYIRVPPDEERFYKKKQSSEKYLKNGLILVGTSLLVFWLTWLTIRTGAADRDSLGDILATEELLELKQLQSQLHFQLMNKTGADHLDNLDAAVITSELQKLKQEIKNHERDARQLTPKEEIPFPKNIKTDAKTPLKDDVVMVQVDISSELGL